MFDAEKYIRAQSIDYKTALMEISEGRKRSHWIWYVFPQIAGLGKSGTSEYYAIKDLDEARDYLKHPVLGKRLIEISEKLLENNNSAEQILGFPDCLKVRSCMTLFHEADSSIEVFQKVIDKFYGGNPDKLTLDILKSNVPPKPSRIQMTEVFNDTIDMINEYPVLSDAVENSVKNTVLYKPDSEYNLPENPNFNCEITVTKCRTFEAAEKLSQKYPDEKICVLNFASATNPGGGVRTGARAQEESLCRCSTLFPCLDTQKLTEKYYNFHINLRNTLYTHMCIYTPDIFVIKTDTNIPERMTEDKWYKTDVITCAAPNLRHNPDMISKDELFSIHEKRAKMILTSAILNGDSVIVLGAFGCGAFKNDPFTVAKAYRRVLDELGGYFKHIEFAVFCAGDETLNYDAFRKTFNK